MKIFRNLKGTKDEAFFIQIVNMIGFWASLMQFGQDPPLVEGPRHDFISL